MDALTSGSNGRLISAAEVARLAGVTRAAVSNWRRRHADFPEPVGGGRNALFSLTDVTDWLDRQRKSADVSDEVLVWQEMRAHYGDDMIAGVADLAEIFTGGAGGRYDEATRLRIQGMAGQSSPFDVVETFTERIVAAGGTLTTRRLAAVITRFVGDVSGTVFDPACGAGSLLLPFVAGARLVAQEINESAARLARTRAELHGTDIEVRVGDSLQSDLWPKLRADLVLCDPPVGLTDWGRDSLLVDSRWEFGAPTKAESELAWLQHCYSHVKQGGRMVVVMSPSVAYRRAGKRIRAEILRAGVLEQVVGLPPGLVASHAQPMHLWFLKRPLDDQRAPSSVRMVDLATVALDELLDSVPGGEVNVPVIELLDEEVDLTPAVHMPATKVDQAEEYAAVRESILSHLQRVARILPELFPGPGVIEGGTLRISDLARAGLVEVSDRNAVSVSSQLDTDYLQGFLHSGQNTSRNSSNSGTYRVDVRGSRIPQMGIEEQRAYGAAFRALDEAEAALRELNELGLDGITRARGGLTSGALRPKRK